MDAWLRGQDPRRGQCSCGRVCHFIKGHMHQMYSQIRAIIASIEHVQMDIST
jgi:hypothetical protein